MGNLDNVRVVFAGFEPCAESKENIMIVFSSLLDEVPYDAFLEVSLSKVATGFEGRLEVNSIACEFKSTQTALAPQELVDTLAKDLRLQLTEWKSKRFPTSSQEIIA